MRATDIERMTAVAVEGLHERPHLRLLEPAPPEVEPWEVHSELAVVSAEVRTHALDQLPERRPYVFLDFPTATVVPDPVAESQLSYEVPAYVLQRVLQMAQTALTLVGALATIALAAELFR
jgi:hypothetical protein